MPTSKYSWPRVAFRTRKKRKPRAKGGLLQAGMKPTEWPIRQTREQSIASNRALKISRENEPLGEDVYRHRHKGRCSSRFAPPQALRPRERDCAIDRERAITRGWQDLKAGTVNGTPAVGLDCVCRSNDKMSREEV